MAAGLCRPRCSPSIATAAIQALIGGTDYDTSKFNRVTQAQRQPGSTFKTFVYAAALESGLGTEDVRYDEPVVIHGWRPRNYDEGYRGAVTLRTAFALSINTVAAEVAAEVGPEHVAEVARRLGVTTMPDRNTYVPPSIALGSIEINAVGHDQCVRDLHERRHAASIPTSCQPCSTAPARRSIAARRTRRARVIDEEIVRQMTSMMGAVVLRGTGTGAQLAGRDVAGKTGTSSDWRDAWFVGYTADLHRRRLGRPRRLHLDGPHHRRHAAGANLERRDARRPPRH